MKKILTLAFCVASFGLLAASVEEVVSTVGVTAITSSYTTTVVCVSYPDLLGGNMTVSNLVKTANLTAGDKLYAYDNGNYECWELTAGTGGVKYWQQAAKQYKVVSNLVEEIESSSASVVTKAVGTGLFLVRGSNWGGSEFTFYIYGQEETPGSTTVTNGTTVLIGNPTRTPKAPTISGAVDGDAIWVPNGKPVMKRYRFNGTNWTSVSGWGSPTAGSLPTMPAGTGFWYVSTNSTHTATISWSAQ